MLKRWQTIKSKKVFKCSWFEVIHNKVKIPTRKIIDYFYIKTHSSVMIIPVTKDNKIIFEKQYRYPANDFFLELPAGNSDGENTDKAAKRELEEETGYRAKSIKKIGRFAPWNGVASEICYIYLAKDLQKTNPRPDKTEFFEIKKISVKEAYKMIKENKIQDGMTLAAMTLARKYLFI